VWQVHHNEADGVAIQDNAHASISGCLVLGNLWSGMAVRDRGRLEAVSNQVHNNGAAGIAMIDCSTGVLRRNCVTGHLAGDIQNRSKASDKPKLEHNTHHAVSNAHIDRVSAVGNRGNFFS
jgi:parallel beta-helix repeat protein